MPQHHLVASGNEKLHINGDLVLWRPYGGRFPAQTHVAKLLKEMRRITGMRTTVSDIILDDRHVNVLLAFEHTGSLTVEQVMQLWPGKDVWYNAIRHGEQPFHSYPVWLRSYTS